MYSSTTIAFLIPVFSALRLAKFNIDERQSSSFLGLPTPANALFWAFLLYGIVSYSSLLSVNQILFAKIIVFAVIPIFSFLLVSEIPMFSFKFKNFSWQKNKLRFVFLACSCVLFILFKQHAFPLIIVLYILFSLFNWVYQSVYDKSRQQV